MRTIVLLLLPSLIVAGCGHVDTRERTVKRLQSSIQANGLHVRLVDRHHGLIGPPRITGCDPPLIAFAQGDRDGFVTIYVCASEQRAKAASVTRVYPGRRIRRGKIVLVANSSPRLRQWITGVVDSVARRG